MIFSRQFAGCCAAGLYALTSLPGPAPFLAAQDRAEDSRLVPAALGIRTDRKGTSWNIEPNGTIGRIGSTMVNSGLALSIDGETFAGFQPMMTPDGKEFVIPGRPFSSHPGLQVQRRIRLLEDEGILRYAEMLYNGSTDPLTVTLSLNTNFSGNYQTFLTNRGRTEPVLLEDGESGIVVLPGVAQSTRAFLFTLCGRESPVKPSVSAQNRYGLGFQYPLTLAPGDTGIVVHQVSQVIIPRNFDRPTLIKLFRPYSFEETSTEIPDEWREHLTNLNADSLDFSLSAPGAFGLSSLGIEPGPRDILALGEKTRLLGEATGDPAEILSPYGRAVIPFQEIAALEGAKGQEQRRMRLFLKDGQVFTAEVSVPSLAFTQAGGDRLEIDPTSLDRLVLAGTETREPREKASTLLVETYRGDRIRVAASDASKIEGITPWGRLPLPLSDIIRLQPAPAKLNGHWAELSDGTRCLLYLGRESLSLNSLTFGEIELETPQLRSLFTATDLKRGQWDSEVGIRTVIRLAGSQRLVGDLSNRTIPVVSEGIRLDIAGSKIRRIERLTRASAAVGGIPESAPSFQIERWDGGLIIGVIDLDLLSFNVRGQEWRIPLRDISRLETPSPELTAATIEEISALINQLGAAQWETREAATRELGAFGYLASPMLRRQLRETEDPEVTRRIERILAGLN